MNDATRDAIFHAQCENVREHDRAWSQIVRAMNSSLARSDDVGVRVHTRLLALTFCSWAEANFVKLIHTPHGFTDDEIGNIQSAKSDSIGAAWQRAVTLGLARVEHSKNSGFVPNAKQVLGRLIEDYVTAPAELRNKIAHGQWVKALNRKNTALNETMTTALDALNWVQLERWRRAHRGLALVVEALVESPRKAFPRDYWGMIQQIDRDLDEMASWTMEHKAGRLRARRQKR